LWTFKDGNDEIGEAVAVMSAVAMPVTPPVSTEATEKLTGKLAGVRRSEQGEYR
jgi:hypothetical protein